jgi:voltage-gated potassium channel
MVSGAPENGAMRQEPDEAGIARPVKVIRRAAATCSGLLILYFVIPVDASDTTSALVVRVIVSLLAFGGLILAINMQLLRQIHEPDAPLSGLLAGVVAGLLFFALLDYAIAVHTDGEFVDLTTRIDALYFALATLATIGYGDVHAQGQFARSVVCVQMVFDVAILATAGSMLARQIGARVRRRSSR